MSTSWRPIAVLDANVLNPAPLRDLLIRLAEVSGYEHREQGLVLPDRGDVHVLAAALHADATVIVTANLSDFPAAALDPFGVEAVGPDQFVSRLVAQDWEGVMDVIERQAAALNTPPMSVNDVLDALVRNGLPLSIGALRAAAES